MTYPIQKTDAEWQAVLKAKKAEPLAYEVTRHAVTERPFTGKYEQFWSDGTYHCVCCGAKLFDSDTKFDAGCGWPSFWQAVPGAIAEVVDRSHNMVRVETVCSRCGAHLGHVFEDGPHPTGLRYCMNSAALDFMGDVPGITDALPHDENVQDTPDMPAPPSSPPAVPDDTPHRKGDPERQAE